MIPLRTQRMKNLNLRSLDGVLKKCGLMTSDWVLEFRIWWVSWQRLEKIWTMIFLCWEECFGGVGTSSLTLSWRDDGRIDWRIFSTSWFFWWKKSFWLFEVKILKWFDFVKFSSEDGWWNSEKRENQEGFHEKNLLDSRLKVFCVEQTFSRVWKSSRISCISKNLSFPDFLNLYWGKTTQRNSSECWWNIFDLKILSLLEVFTRSLVNLLTISCIPWFLWRINLQWKTLLEYFLGIFFA